MLWCQQRKLSLAENRLRGGQLPSTGWMLPCVSYSHHRPCSAEASRPDTAGTFSRRVACEEQGIRVPTADSVQCNVSVLFHLGINFTSFRIMKATVGTLSKSNLTRQHHRSDTVIVQ